MEKQNIYFTHSNTSENNEQKMGIESDSESMEEKSKSGNYKNEWHQEYEIIYQSYTIDAG